VLWRDTEGDARLSYPGLIQTALGLSHLEKGNLRGAKGQLTKALDKLERYGDSFSGIDNNGFMRQVRPVLAELKVLPVSIKDSSS
jgi:predicted metal-dependent hydrolase